MTEPDPTPRPRPVPTDAPGGPLPWPEGLEREAWVVRRADGGLARARRGAETLAVRVEVRGDEALDLELALLARVEHPGLARLVDHGPLPGGGAWLAREWVEGEPLSAWARGRPPREVGLRLADLAPALQHLHGAGFVHGDVKAANAVVDGEGRPRWIDFGMARPLGVQAAAGGSSLHLAPERLAGLPASAAADRFAFGAMLVDLLAPRPVDHARFHARFPADDFWTAADLRPEDLPEWARDLAARLVLRDPDGRPPDLLRVAEQLGSRLGRRARGPRVAPRGDCPPWLGREAERAALLAARPGTVRVAPPVGDAHADLVARLRLEAALAGRPAWLVTLEPEQLRDDRARADWARGWAERLGDGLGLLDTSDGGLPLEDLGRAVEWLARSAPGATLLWFDPRHPTPDVALPPVPEAALVPWLEERLGPHPGLPDLAARLHAESGGSPRQLARRLDAVLASDSVQLTAEGPRLRPTPLPDHLGRGATGGGERWEAGVARTVAFALHVLGGRASAGNLARAADLDGAALHAVLTEQIAHGRLRLRGAAVELRVAPPSLPFAEQRTVHGRVVELLEPGPLRDVHRFLADPGEDELARLRDGFERARRAGRAARVLRALDRLRALTPGDDELLELERALTLAVLGDPVGARRALGLPEAGEDGPDAVPGESDEPEEQRLLRLRALARLARHERRLDDAHALLGEAARLDPELAAERLALEAEQALARGDHDAVEALAERARDAAGPPAAQRNVELLHAVSLARRGAVEPALARLHALEAESRSESRSAGPGADGGPEDGDEVRAAVALNVAVLERGRGDLDAAREAARRARDLRAGRGDLAGEAQASALLGALARDAGHWLDAQAHLEAVARSRELLGDVPGAAEARASLALVAAERGHVAEALQGLERALDELDPAARAAERAWIAARAHELRRRCDPAEAEPEGLAADPRVDLCLGRARWCAGDEPGALEALARAAATPDPRTGADEEARTWIAQGTGGPAPPPALHPAVRELREVLAALGPTPDTTPEPGKFEDEDAGDPRDRDADAIALAERLEALGREDRAARVWLAVAHRDPDGPRHARATSRAHELLERCLVGLDPPARERARTHLLGVPDPWPEELERRDEELEMDVLRVLEINQRLVEQQDLPALLGTIVEQALDLAGAERGFLVLEQDGRLSFDLALDSRRGDLAEPEVELSRTIVHEALDHGRTLCLADAGVDPLVGSAPSIQRLDLRSVLCHPFDVDPGLRGVLYLDHRSRPGVFGSRVERAVTLLAGQAALAIRQVHRLQQIRRLNDDLAREATDKESEAREARRALAAHGLVAPVAGLVGSSRAMRQVHSLLRKAAPSPLSVLVVGESGTGKELAARAVHDLSPRREGPFVAENCAALPASLVEAELFGHVAGAFTGAERDAAGLFERAHGGTLFLDEVGELPSDAQAKLLRALETRRVRRVGDDRERPVDFRLVCATNRDLDREVAEGRFRQDLLYRLDGVRVPMPPLRERLEDLPELVDHFLRFEERRDGVSRRCSAAVLERLTDRSWPGNVRELANEVARLCVLSDGDLDDPELVRQPGASPAATLDPRPAPLADLERRAILQAIEYCEGDKRRAAELLGISRAKVYQRLKEWREDA